MNLCDFFFSHLPLAPNAAPCGGPRDEADWELDDGNGSAMHIGDWLAVNERTADRHERAAAYLD